MRRIFYHLFLVTSCFLCSHALAQEGVISGVVTSSDNESLPGVTIQVKGTSRTTVTDINGKFSIAATKGETLTFSSVGFATQEILLQSISPINLKLQKQSEQLGEVIVTAYGIKRDPRSLGYNAPVVQGDDIAQTRRENFLNSLAGRVPGATITPSSGTPGASSQIILRGATSIGGNNQPLIVVDGVPYDNQTLNQEGLIGGASVAFNNRNSDYGNRAMDINPQDIESVTILKGPEATALYGADGASGAIVVTTKKGKTGKASITYDNSFRAEKIYRFPEVQTQYSIGTNGVFDANAVVNPFAIFGAGGGVPSAFGPKIPEGTKIYDNVNSFFKTGFTQQHNITAEGGTENSSLRFSANYTNQDGTIPQTGYEKLAFRLSGATKLGSKVNLSSSLNYVNSTTDKASKGAGNYLLSLLTWPSYNDVSDYANPDGTRKSIRNISNFALEYDNPFWDVNKNPSQDKVDRFTGNVTIGSDITKWLNLGAILGLDYYTQYGSLATHPLSRFGFASNGFYSLYTQSTRNLSNIFKTTIRKNFEKVTNSFTAGFAFENNNTKLESQKGERFYERDFYSINNTDPLSRDARTTVSQVRKTRMFANLVTGFNNLLFLSLAGSREGVSTFMSKVVDKDPYFNYGSASLSFVFSDLSFFKNIDWFSYGKLRASYASTGKGPYAPYVIDYRFAPQISTGGGYAYDVTGNNFGLEPEYSKNLELGFELKFLKNRISLDVARYSLKSEKQLLAARASYGTGFVIKWFNGGLVENKGLEVSLNIIPVKTKNFNWQSTFNFDRNVGKILEMPSDLPAYYDSDTWVFGNLRSQYFKGAKIGNLASNTLKRNNAGQVLISTTTGLPIRDEEFKTVGDRQPDFKLGWVNELTYNDFGLSFNLDFRKGGDVFNGTEFFLYLTGYSTKNLDREKARVIEGVLQDGLENTATPTKNTIAITPLYNSNFYGTSAAGVNAAAEDDFVEEVNWMRLRDITLSYRLPNKLISRQKIVKTASVFVTGTDVFMVTNYSGADPAVNANNAAARGFGGAGIDFGSVSTPRGINFGLRVTL